MSRSTRLLFACLAIAWASSVAAVGAPARPPNIVFILADDLDAAAATKMPLVRQYITEAGTSFNRHFVSLSLCCPSRVTTLRGQFAHNTGVYTNGSGNPHKPPTGGFEYVYAHDLEASTVATWLKGAGYKTALYGKYLNGYPDTAPRLYIPPGWQDWSSPIAGDPYAEFDYVLNTNGKEERYGSAPEDYLTDVIAHKAVRFIQDAKDTPDKPFFLYLAPFAPHYPATPAPRHAGYFKGILAPRVPSFNEADVDDKPHWVRRKPLLDQAQIGEIDHLYEHRRESLLAIDELVRDVVQTLAATGQLANTYVFFTSDNGYHQGQHRLESGKDTAYEEDLIVPLVVRGPGVALADVTAITANVDYASTFAEIAGVTPKLDVDGRSLLPFLRGQTPASWRQVLLLEHSMLNAKQDRRYDRTREPSDPFDDSPNGIKPFYGLRLADGRTYVEYIENDDCEIYLPGDPYELKNTCTKGKGDQPALGAWLDCLKDLAGEDLRQAELGPGFCERVRSKSQ
jgi:arylsulfatase A-like enzyme